MRGFTFDAGGLIALDRQDREVVVLIKRHLALGVPITIPATVLAQVMSNPGRQVVISALIVHPLTTVEPLTRADAIAIGKILRDSRTSDVVDAHVVLCAQRRKQDVLTSDPKDLRRIDPSLRLVLV